MSTGLFELMKEVKQPEKIIRFYNSSSYDELIEIDLNNYRFRSINHVENKYAMPMLQGSYKDLFIGLSEDVVHPDERERLIELMNPETLIHKLKASEIPGLWSEDFRFRMVNGGWRWIELTIITGREYMLKDNILRMYIFDCQSRKSRELGLSDIADYTDNNRNEMTGLLRKRAFVREAQQLIKNTDVNWCLVSIDIDNFKLFNEWYGHSEGDLLMVQIGVALHKISEHTKGTAGYFGQDDFCLMIPRDMERIKRLYDEIADLVTARGSGAGFLPAFGICDVDPKCEFRDLLDRACLACQVAKKGYHSRIRVFEEGMYKRTDEEYHVLSDFLHALKRREVTFYLQPQCNASTGKIVGAEALARWVKPDGTIVPPDVFIPVLEKRGLIYDLDFYIWDEVCRWQKQWIDHGNTPLPVSVNASVADILHNDLPAVFDNLAEQYGLERRLIKIEITESSFISNSEPVRNTVYSLQQKGFTVLMDDFGSGYSSLNMLKDLNVDIIKLDAQFMNTDNINEEKSIRILESIANMTKTIGVPIIVEGVETAAQKVFLQDLGCDYIQGYFFYRPMKVSDYEALIADDDVIDTSGIVFKTNRQFRLREMLDSNIYSDSMFNCILGPCALYSWHDDIVDIIRYNEQFYQAVDVPDFAERVTCISRFMPSVDVPRLTSLLQKALHDRLNGSEGTLHFYKTDGSLTTFYMHFYYLHSDGENKIFYGSVRNTTKLSNLEKQMSLLSHISKETVLFLSRTHDGEIRFTVLFNGLESELEKAQFELEELLNNEAFISQLSSRKNSATYEMVLQSIKNSENFTAQININKPDGAQITLDVKGTYMPDETDVMNYIVILSKHKD